MRKISLLLLSLAAFYFLRAQQHVHAENNKQMTVADWQYDLKFLQQTIHKDYPFLLKKISPSDFDAEVNKLHAAIPSLQDHEVMAGFSRIVSSIKYGHTSVNWRESPVKYTLVPLSLYWFSDGVFVEAAEKTHAALAGARLLKVEGMDVDKALAAVKPLVPAENDQFFKAYGLDYLLIPEALHAQKVTKELKKNLILTFEKDGKQFEQTLPAVPAYRLPRQYGFVTNAASWASARKTETTPYYLKNLDKIYYFEYLPEYKTVYVRHSQIQDEKDEPIPVFYEKVFDFIEKNDVQKLVLDVRLNGGGNNYKNKPIVTGVIRSKINKPGQFFVITGRRTFSACQNLVNELHNYTNALFVGEPTSENINFYGDNRRVELPISRTPVFLSFAWWQDKPQWENGPWLAPQAAIDMSFSDFQNNRDPVLDYCLNFNETNPVLDPYAHLQQLFMDGKMEELEITAMKMIKDPLYRYINFETRINDAGYQLLNGNQVQQALMVFQFNAKLFPLSANTWDSLAEAHWKAGQKDKAREYYNKAISMDPDGPTGENARSMLKKIDEEKK